MKKICFNGLFQNLNIETIKDVFKNGLFLKAFLICGFVLSAPETFPQGKISADAKSGLPVKKISLLTSGVGYFEHSGNVNGKTEIELSFGYSDMNDALKSIAVRDESGETVEMRYPAENAMWKTLEGLSVDLRGFPGIIDILRMKTGEEVSISWTDSIPQSSSAQAGVSESAQNQMRLAKGVLLSSNETSVSVYTDSGIVIIPADGLKSVTFSDAELNSDLQKALSILKSNNNSNSKKLSIFLNGSGFRNVNISYVIPAAVWKASYRLDLGSQTPFLQAWAIVDNDSESDWESAQLTLVSGRPVSFVQMLYPPYHLSRQVRPLEIAGAADALVYDGAMEDSAVYDQKAMELMKSAQAPRAAYGGVQSDSVYTARNYAENAGAAFGVSGAGASTSGAERGFSYEWTIKQPVTIPKGQSAMLPLTEGAVDVKKVLVYNGRNIGSSHPQAGVEITNTTDELLPPGPLTIFDNGGYAGDALISFLGAGEKRLVSYAEDLSVSGHLSVETKRSISSVKISGGVMALTRKISYDRVYSFNNTAKEDKAIIIEHPITANAVLSVPENPDEKTASSYRFNFSVPAGTSAEFKVSEEIPQTENLTLANFSVNTFLTYSSNAEIPSAIRDALRKAVELRQAADAAVREAAEINTELERARTDQERVRANLEAVGVDSEAGAEYLKSLREADAVISGINKSYTDAIASSRESQKAYQDYLAELDI